VTLLDTAGIRESDDPVEQEGVRRAKARAEAADLVLWVVEAGAEDTQRDEKKSEWIVHNKVDLSTARAQREGKSDSYAISALTGEGVDQLVSDLAGFARDSFQGGESALVTRGRHRVALQQTRDALVRALALGPSAQEELIAEELRLAARALGRLTGRVDVEDVLDVIFRDFCIGK
jgi:tRNA modification GTPase